MRGDLPRVSLRSPGLRNRALPGQRHILPGAGLALEAAVAGGRKLRQGLRIVVADHEASTGQDITLSR